MLRNMLLATAVLAATAFEEAATSNIPAAAESGAVAVHRWGGGPFDRYGGLPRVLAQLSLTDDQQAQIPDIVAAERSAREARRPAWQVKPAAVTP